MPSGNLLKKLLFESRLIFFSSTMFLGHFLHILLLAFEHVVFFLVKSYGRLSTYRLYRLQAMKTLYFVDLEQCFSTFLGSRHPL